MVMCIALPCVCTWHLLLMASEAETTTTCYLSFRYKAQFCLIDLDLIIIAMFVLGCLQEKDYACNFVLPEIVSPLSAMCLFCGNFILDLIIMMTRSLGAPSGLLLALWALRPCDPRTVAS